MWYCTVAAVCVTVLVRCVWYCAAAAVYVTVLVRCVWYCAAAVVAGVSGTVWRCGGRIGHVGGVVALICVALLPRGRMHA